MNDKKRPADDELKMPGDEFDRIMRSALGVPRLPESSEHPKTARQIPTKKARKLPNRRE